MDISTLNRNRARTRWARIHSIEQNEIFFHEELVARICGFLAGDGSVNIRIEKSGKVHHILEFFPDDESLFLPFLESLWFVYHKTPKLVRYKNHYRFRLFSKVVVNDLLSVASFGTYSWKVPTSLLNTKDAKIEWLRAFFDAEAHVGEHCIKLQSVNKYGLLGVRRLLQEFGIHTRIYEYEPRTEGWNKVYILTIGKERDRLKFLKQIGFNHRKKTERLLSILDNAEIA